MRNFIVRLAPPLAMLMALLVLSRASKADDRAEILKTRETVWRAWFAGDTKTLSEFVPTDAIAISAGEGKWKHQAEVLQSAADFHAAGGKLISLEFPHTEVQHFGKVFIIWSEYILELEAGGKRSRSSGRVTEIFVKRNGQWTNPGWHTDSEPSRREAITRSGSRFGKDAKGGIMTNITGPDFITLMVSDLEASYRFYKEKIGLNESSEQRPNAHAFTTAPCGLAIRLAADKPKTEHPGQGIIVWLKSSNATTLYEELKGREVPIVEELRQGPFGMTFSFKDPDGYVLTVHDGG